LSLECPLKAMSLRKDINFEYLRLLNIFTSSLIYMRSEIFFNLSSNTLKSLFFIVGLFFYGSSLFSQKELLLQANTFFNEKKYSEAIPLYLKIYEKKSDRNILLKIADCNFLNENYPQAQKYYAEYFRDSVYENIQQFVNYAKSSKATGKIALAVKLYQKLYEITQDASARSIYDIYKFYLDSVRTTRSYDLDSNYNCVVIDALESRDTLAAPMFYSWSFDDGKTEEGIKVEHCFAVSGEHKVMLNITDKTTGLVRARDTMLVLQLRNMPVQFISPKGAKKYFFTEFDAGDTSIPGYEILDYLWDMDNGDIASGKKIKYRYNDSRDYYVKLIVIAENKYTGRRELFSANRRFEVSENYEMPSKKFTDSLNGAK
jgi:hypothetical protein